MSKSAMNVAKGVGIGAIAGMTAVAIGSAVMQKKGHSGKNSKSMKKTAGKAVHAVNEILSGMESMLG